MEYNKIPLENCKPNITFSYTLKDLLGNEEIFVYQHLTYPKTYYNKTLYKG